MAGVVPATFGFEMAGAIPLSWFCRAAATKQSTRYTTFQIQLKRKPLMIATGQLNTFLITLRTVVTGSIQQKLENSQGMPGNRNKNFI